MRSAHTSQPVGSDRGCGSQQVGGLVAELLVTAEQQVSTMRASLLHDCLSRLLFDHIVCATAGIRARPALRGLSSGTSGPATIIGAYERSVPAAAASVNAASAYVHDRDDVHWGTLTHLGSIVWPAVLAAAEESNAAVGDAFQAAALGYEVGVRVARAFGGGHRLRWHVTATAGTVAAAAGAAAALGLSRAAVTAAVCHAVSVAGGSAQSVAEHSDTVLFHRSHAAVTGIHAAYAARAGMVGARCVLEGERGVLGALTDEPHERALLEPREHCAVEEIAFRLLPATGFAHCSIEAARELAPADSTRIASVLITVPQSAAALARNPTPTTVAEAWWSIPFAVAVTLVRGVEHLDNLRSVTDDEVQALVSRTTLAVRRAKNPEDLASSVAVTMDDGRTERAVCELPPGHPRRRPTDEELVRKCLVLTRAPNAAGAVALLQSTDAAADESLRGLMKTAASALHGWRSGC